MLHAVLRREPRRLDVLESEPRQLVRVPNLSRRKETSMTLLKYCVIRGGAWYQALYGKYGKEYTLASYRGPQDARKDSSFLGFRTTLAGRTPLNREAR